MSDLIHKIVGKIIEVGQSDTTKFRLGETIRYTPSEILEILKQYESEIFGEESSTQTNAPKALNALDCKTCVWYVWGGDRYVCCLGCCRDYERWEKK